MKKAIFILFVVGLILIAFFLPAKKGFSQATVELKLASQYPVGAPMHELLTEWTKRLESESKGRLKIRIFPGGTLLSPLDLYDGVVKGVADMSAGWRYRSEGYEVGILLPTFMTVPSVEIASSIFDELWKEFPEIRNEWKDVKPLWMSGSVSVNLFTRKEFKKLDDLRGMQIRSPDKANAAMLKDLGMSPVFMSTADLPVALEKGTVDGACGAITLITDYKLERRVKSVLKDEFSFTTPNWLIINKDSYNKLPPDLKKIIDDSCDWGRKRQIEIWTRENNRVYAHCAESGISVVSFTKEEAERFYSTIRQTHSKLASELDSKGYPGTKILKFIGEKAKSYPVVK